MIKIEHITVNFEDVGVRLEKFILSKFKIYNYIYLQKLIRTGQIRVNKKRVKLGYILKLGDILRLPITKYSSDNSKKSSKSSITLDNLSLKERSLANFLLHSILYQDDHIIAINKPKGLSIQGGKNIITSLDKLLPYFKISLNIKYSSQLKIVHRLDKGTSGILLLAKTNAGAKHLFAQFKEQKVIKTYYCLVQGKICKSDTIKANILKVNNCNNKSIVNKSGKYALTEYEVIQVSPNRYSEINNTNNCYNITFLKVYPKTGRNHQIRVHLSYVLNTPIVGDFKYGYKTLNLPFKLVKNEIFLHAHSISFYNLENKKIDIIAPLDEKWNYSLKKLSIQKY